MREAHLIVTLLSIVLPTISDEELVSQPLISKSRILLTRVISPNQ